MLTNDPRLAPGGSQRFYRRERLRSLYAIDRLFARQTGGRSVSADQSAHAPATAIAFPWRAVALPSADPGVTFPRVLIMVPKRRLRHAVDRVTMRRRLREAYRRLKAEIILPGRGVDIAFIYIGPGLTSYEASCKSVRKIFNRINSSLFNNETPSAQTDS